MTISTPIARALATAAVAVALAGCAPIAAVTATPAPQAAAPTAAGASAGAQGAGTPQGTSGAAGAAPAPTSAPVGAQAPVGERSALLTTARAEIQQAFTGDAQRDILSILTNAESSTNDEQTFGAYVGAWQLMRLHYTQSGGNAAQKQAMDALEAVAKTFPQYDPSLFQLEKAKA